MNRFTQEEIAKAAKEMYQNKKFLFLNLAGRSRDLALDYLHALAAGATPPEPYDYYKFDSDETVYQRVTAVVTRWAQAEGDGQQAIRDAFAWIQQSLSVWDSMQQ